MLFQVPVRLVPFRVAPHRSIVGPGSPSIVPVWCLLHSTSQTIIVYSVAADHRSGKAPIPERTLLAPGSKNRRLWFGVSPRNAFNGVSGAHVISPTSVMRDGRAAPVTPCRDVITDLHVADNDFVASNVNCNERV